MKTIFLGDIPITFDRRRIKNINLYIRPPHGDVLVTAPLRFSEKRIMEFLFQKEDWIRTHRCRMIEREKRRAQDGANQESDPRGAEDRSVTPGQLANLKEKIAQYAAKWEPVMGVHCIRWTIRDMKSRWGSCSVQRKTIRINLQLAKKPEECLEYVVVHELTHLLEASHNQRFHAYMKTFLPDYRERKRRLDRGGFTENEQKKES